MDFDWRHDQVNNAWTRHYVGNLWACVYPIRNEGQDDKWRVTIMWRHSGNVAFTREMWTYEGAKRVATKQAKEIKCSL